MARSKCGEQQRFRSNPLVACWEVKWSARHHCYWKVEHTVGINGLIFGVVNSSWHRNLVRNSRAIERDTHRSGQLGSYCFTGLKIGLDGLYFSEHIKLFFGDIDKTMEETRILLFNWKLLNLVCSRAMDRTDFFCILFRLD